MHPACVGVPPEPLQRSAGDQRGGTGRLEQQVDRGDRARSRPHLVTARTGTQFVGDLLARLQQGVLVADIADQLTPRRIDIAGGLGDAHLGERIVLGLLTGEGGPHTLALMLDMGGIRAIGHTDDRRRDGGGMHGAPRHLVDRCGVVLVAARGAVVHGLVGQEPVRGHEHVLDDDGVAAGALESDDMPDIVDRVFGARDQEAAEAHRPAVLDDRAAEERPGGVFTTRGPLPCSADQVATVDHGACAHRGVGGRDAHGRIVTPHLVLGTLVEQCQMPVVHADDRADPAGRPACAGQPPNRLVEDRRIGL